MRQVRLGDWQCDDRTRELVNQVLDSGRVSYGPISREFEQRFSQIHGCQYGVLSNSGTSSLQVALQALKEIHGWADGDEVIVPALTFVATVNIVIHNRMAPVLVDIEPDYYAVDPSLIEAAITPKTRAIIPVHPFGQPADMTAIREIANRHALKIIEDSCECMFASQNGEMVGSMSDIGCFSLYMAHLITAGVGGVATTNNPDYAAKMRSLVNHGRDGIYISIDDDANGSRETIERRFSFDSVGHSFRITEFEAALALAQLDSYPSMVNHRRMNGIVLKEMLFTYSDFIRLPRIREKDGHSFMMFPVVLSRGDKWDLIHHLESNGIETREMLPLTNQPVYADWCNEDNHPVAKHINNQGFYIGCHPYLKAADLTYIHRIFSEYFATRREREPRWRTAPTLM